MRLFSSALCKAPICAVVLFLAACNGTQHSLPFASGAQGSVRAKPAIDGVTTGGKYKYKGCQVYNGNGTPATGDPYANANVSVANVDLNSSNVLSNAAIITAFGTGFQTSSDAGLEIVNIATSSTTTYTAHALSSGGHSGPLTLPAPSGYGATGPVPWQPGPTPPAFLFEGSYTSTCPADCHWETLNTSNCYVFEGNAAGSTGVIGGFISGVFSTANGFIDDLGATYSSQWANKFDNWSVAGIPAIGFTDFGEDFALTSINHPLQVIFPPAMVQDVNVNLSPGPGGDGTCGPSDSACLDFGDILRLKSTVGCGTDPKTVLVCNQLKTYGAMVADTGTTPQFRFGLTSSGSDPISSPTAPIWSWMGGLSLANFDIITRGALVP